MGKWVIDDIKWLSMLNCITKGLANEQRSDYWWEILRK